VIAYYIINKILYCLYVLLIVISRMLYTCNTDYIHNQ